MNITDYAIKELVPYIIGKRKGSELVDLFNQYGARDIYDELGLPDINKLNGQRPSKKEYVFKRVKEINNKYEIRELIKQIALENIEQVEEINNLLIPEKYKIEFRDGQTYLMGGVIDNRKPVVNDAHFQDIQNRILEQLEKARVSIRIIMAWFTSDILFQKLIDKHNQGVDVKIGIYNDGINKKHGVDISLLPNYLINRGKRGGLMHDKFCIIDNQIVITGSYNWTNNAEFRNDENITIEIDPNQATRYSEEFIRLTK